MASDRPGRASRAERFRTYHTAYAAGAWNAASSRGNAGRAIPPPAPALHRRIDQPEHVPSHTPYQGERSSA